MAEDEYLEITPTSVRLRKQLLTEMRGGELSTRSSRPGAHSPAQIRAYSWIRHRHADVFEHLAWMRL